MHVRDWSWCKLCFFVVHLGGQRWVEVDISLLESDESLKSTQSCSEPSFYDKENWGPMGWAWRTDKPSGQVLSMNLCRATVTPGTGVDRQRAEQCLHPIDLEIIWSVFSYLPALALLNNLRSCVLFGGCVHVTIFSIWSVKDSGFSQILIPLLFYSSQLFSYFSFMHAFAVSQCLLWLLWCCDCIVSRSVTLFTSALFQRLRYEFISSWLFL